MTEKSAFSLYTGDVHPTGPKGKSVSLQTQEYRRLLVESVASGWITIEGSTLADLKKWNNKLRPQAQSLDLGMKFGTTDEGKICFRAHEFEDGPGGRRVPKKHAEPAPLRSGPVMPVGKAPAKAAPAKKAATPATKRTTATRKGTTTAKAR